MKWKKYTYTAQWGRGGTIAYRPLIEIQVSNGTGTDAISILALIDSGTDGTVFNADIARSLGIDPNGCQKVRLGGIGMSEGFMCDIRMALTDLDFEITLPVIFIEKPPFDALLGQRHFFQNFKVKFEKDKNTFQLAKVDQRDVDATRAN